MLDARRCNAFNQPQREPDVLTQVRELVRAGVIPTGQELARRSGLSLGEAGQVIGQALELRRG